MKLVAGPGRRPLEVEALAKSGDRPPTSLIEGLPLADEGFEAIRQQCTDGPTFFSGHHARFSQQVGVEFQRDVSFHDSIIARQ
jgi:hypothetical protein